MSRATRAPGRGASPSRRRRKERRVRSAIGICDLTEEAVNVNENSPETVEETKSAESAFLLFPLLASLPGPDVLLYCSAMLASCPGPTALRLLPVGPASLALLLPDHPKPAGCMGLWRMSISCLRLHLLRKQLIKCTCVQISGLYCDCAGRVWRGGFRLGSPSGPGGAGQEAAGQQGEHRQGRA